MYNHCSFYTLFLFRETVSQRRYDTHRALSLQRQPGLFQIRLADLFETRNKQLFLFCR